MANNQSVFAGPNNKTPLANGQSAWNAAPSGGNSSSSASLSDPKTQALLSAPLFGLSQNEAIQEVGVPGMRPAGTENFMGPVAGGKTTAAEAMQSYANMVKTDPNKFKQLQTKLYAGGFYDGILDTSKGELPAFGRLDKKTIQALHDAVVEAAATPGSSVDDILSQAANDAKGNAASSKPKRLTNPDVVKANAESVAQQLTGRRLDPTVSGEIEKRAESLAQQSYTDSNGQVQYYGGSPNDAWLQDQIRQLMPNSVGAYQSAGNMKSLISLIDTQGLFSAYHQ